MRKEKECKKCHKVTEVDVSGLCDTCWTELVEIDTLSGFD